MDDLVLQKEEVVVAERAQSRYTDSPPSAPDHSHDIYTVANIITVLRLILVPLFFAVLTSGPWEGRAMSSDMAAFIIFAIAASTDWVDGQIARRTGTVTEIGKAIDPLVDRLLIASGVLGLYVEARLPLWVVVLLLVRDLYLLAGATYLAKRRAAPVRVIYLGKVTTALLLFGFADLLLNWPLLPGFGVVPGDQLPGFGESPAAVGIWFVYAGIFTSLLTAVIYTTKARRSAVQAAGTESIGGDS